MFRFATNRISTASKPKTLSDIIKAAQTKAAMEKGASASEPTVKTASSTAVVEKTAKKEEKPCPAGDMKMCPKCKGKGKECKCSAQAAAKVAGKEQSEGETSGQPQAEAKLVNDPHDDPKLKETGKGKGTAKSEEAEGSGQLEPKANPQNKPEVKKDASSGKWVKLANLSAAQKAKVRKIWSKFWPPQFIDAALADR